MVKSKENENFEPVYKYVYSEKELKEFCIK